MLADLLTGGYLTLQNAEPTDSPTLLSPDTDSPTLTDSASDDADINLTDLTDFTDGAGGWDGSGGSTTDASPPAPGPVPIRGWWQGPEPDPRPEQARLVKSLTDQITTAQRRAVSARDRHCTARGCTRPPAFTDLHHLIHRQDSGTTTINKHNLHLPYLAQHDARRGVRPYQL